MPERDIWQEHAKRQRQLAELERLEAWLNARTRWERWGISAAIAFAIFGIAETLRIGVELVEKALQ